MRNPALTAADYAELLAACRAAVAAARQGEADPLNYVAAVLEDHGQLPAPGQRPMQLLAQATASATFCPFDEAVWLVRQPEVAR